MIRPGFFTFPIHEPTLVRELIERTRPSLVKVWTSVTSVDQINDWRSLSPDTIFLLVDGNVGDSDTKLHLDNIEQLSSDHAASWARWRDNGYGSLWMTYNEPPIHFGADYRKRFTAYTVAALEKAHAYGLNLTIGNFSVGWPRVAIDDENWWPELLPMIKAMRPEDYLGLHEYWSYRGPTDYAAIPWLTGRHKLCPYNVPILISECGIDNAVIGENHSGWAGKLEPRDYYYQLRQYHAMLDSRVKGTAIFLLDYENNTWESFDIRYLVKEGHFNEDWNMDNPLPIPNKVPLPFDGKPNVTQWFGERPEYYKQFGVAGHNGIDFSMSVGTPLKAIAPGRVTKIAKLNDGYGWHVQVNHGWGMSLYAHMSYINVAEQQDVEAGTLLGASGNTGNSTGPHLHFGLRIYGQSNPGYNDWINPKEMLGLEGTTPAPEPIPVPSSIEQIRDEAIKLLGSEYTPGFALYKYARVNSLGAPLDIERRITVNGIRYACQSFALGIAYCVEGQWDKVKHITY